MATTSPFTFGGSPIGSTTVAPTNTGPKPMATQSALSMLFNTPIYDNGVQIAGPGTQQQDYLNHMASTNTPVGTAAYDPANWVQAQPGNPAPTGWNQKQWDGLTTQQQQRVINNSTPAPKPMTSDQVYMGWAGAPGSGGVATKNPAPNKGYTSPSSAPAGTIGGIQDFGQNPSPFVVGPTNPQFSFGPSAPPQGAVNQGPGTYNPPPGANTLPGGPGWWQPGGPGGMSPSMPRPGGPSATSPIATPTPAYNGGDVTVNGTSYSWLGNNLWMDGMGQTHYFDRNLAKNFLGPEALKFYPSPLMQVGSI